MYPYNCISLQEEICMNMLSIQSISAITIYLVAIIIGSSCGFLAGVLLLILFIIGNTFFKKYSNNEEYSFEHTTTSVA